MERKILHIDVNNAFLSWTALERLKNGETIDIREIPAVIGGDEEKRSGIVLAKSMKAKMCGISTGETLYMARQKCPNVQVFKGEYHKYKEYSNSLYKLLLNYTDRIERYSIDECFLDMTLYMQGKDILNIAHEISKRIYDELGFTVNIGIANNKLLAKMASDFEKPNKIHTLFENEIEYKMWPLPVKELFMLGRKTVPKLFSMRIKTIGDLAKFDRNVLIKKFGKHGNMMWEYANGIDNTEVNYLHEKPKGIGTSITLPMDICNLNKLEEILLELTEQVCFRLRKEKMVAKSVNVQLRTKEFVDFSHQGKLDCYTSSTKEIYKKAKELLREMYKSNTYIRLIGVRVDKLDEEGEIQISLFENDNNKKQEKLDKTIDILKNKYGYTAIVRGTNIKNKDKIRKSKIIE